MGAVDHNDLGLVGQQAERPHRLLFLVGKTERGDRFARVERGLDALDDVEFLELSVAVGTWFFGAGFEPLGAVGDDAEVGEEDFVTKRGEIGGRIASRERTQHDQQGVAFADQREALGVVAVGAGHEAGGVEHLDGGGRDLLRLVQ